MIGQTLGSYRILKLVGAGGMANVCKASDPNTDRYVATKIFPENLSRDPNNGSASSSRITPTYIPAASEMTWSAANGCGH